MKVGERLRNEYEVKNSERASVKKPVKINYELFNIRLMQIN